MIRYSVCAPALFPRVPLCEAVKSIAPTGAKHYEFWGWQGVDLDELFAVQEDTGVTATAMCTLFEPLTVPEKRNAYIDGLKLTIAAARKLGIRTLISQVGADQPGVSHALQHASIVDGLKACAPIVEDSGMTLTIEPLNTLVDHKGYFLESSKEAFDIVDEVGSENVKVLFDVYHQQITEGNVLSNLLTGLSKIGHIHIAGNPGRHEPYTCCELNYGYIINQLKKAGYSGAIGLEYMPTFDPVTSLIGFFNTMPVLPD